MMRFQVHPLAVAFWRFLLLVICFLSSTPSELVEALTRTLSQVEPSGRLYLSRPEYSNIEFTNPYLYPKAVFSLTLEDTTSTPAPTVAANEAQSSTEDTANSFVIDEHSECRSMLVQHGVTGLPWDPDFLSTGSIAQIHQLEEVVVAGVGGEAEAVEQQPQERSYQLDVTILAKNMFWYEVSDNSDTSYEFEVPAICTRLNSQPRSVSFTIAYQKRSAVGRAMTYLHLAASSVALHNVLSGSMISLSLVQQFAIVNGNGCAPVLLQEEAHVEAYAVNPIQVKLQIFRDNMSPEMMRLLCCLFLVASIWFLEGIHWMVTATRHRAKSNSLSRKAAEEQEMEMLAAKKRRIEEEEEYGDATAADEDDNTAFAAPPVAKYVPKDSKVTKVQAPYLAIALTTALMPGVVYNSTKVIFQSDVRYQQFIALVGVVTHGLLPLIIVIGVGRVKELAFVPYVGSFKGKGTIPHWLTPQGVWGPNTMRLTLGPFIEDFKSSRRLFGILVLLYQFVLTLVNASSAPTTESNCRTALWFGLMTNIVYLGLIYYMKPFRSPFINSGFSAQQLALTIHYSMLTYWGGYIHDINHWTYQGLYVTGMLFNTVALAYNICIAFVARWEFYGGKACNHVSKNVDFVGKKSQVQFQTTEEIIEDLKRTFAKGSEENQETERLRQQLVPLEEDDTAAIRYFTQTGYDETVLTAGGGGGNRTHDEANSQLTLADYLLQDMDRLPEDTKIQFYLDQEIHLERMKSAKKLNVGLNLHPDDVPKLRNNPNYIKPRTKPVHLQGFEVYKEKPIPAVFNLPSSLGQDRNENPGGPSGNSSFSSLSLVRKNNNNYYTPGGVEL